MLRQPLPGMAAATDRTGVPGKGGETFLGELRWSGQRLLFLLQQADLVEGDPQVGVDALFARCQVAARIELMGRDRGDVLFLAVQRHHGTGDQQHDQAEQQHIEGFMAGASRAYDLGGGGAHGASMSALSTSTT